MSNPNRKVDSPGITRRSIEERLKDHPELMERLHALADVVENVGNDLEKADQAERRVLEEVRQLGREVLQGWAQRQQRNKTHEALSKSPELKRKEKKLNLAHALRSH
ncbi:MAG: hypothetical protein L0312_11560 [Acidobacteria bacterium]|nr:hypothetical protein [Acidobacteriota bacterium]